MGSITETISQTLSMKEIFFERKFTIPEIQRDYDWEKNKQVKTLLDDLWRYHLHTQNDVPQYFLGTVIVYDGDTKNGFQIMDGQQRITTILAMASAIKAHLEKYLKNV